MALKKSEKNMLVILGVVVVVFIVYKVVIEPGSKKDESTGPAGTGQVTVSAQTAEVVSTPPLVVVKDRAEVKLFTSWKRDPFNAAVTKYASVKPKAARSKTVKIDAPVLMGILMHQNGAKAIIDNEILTEGQTKKGIHVLSINSSEVVCTKGNRTFTLHWSKSR